MPDRLKLALWRYLLDLICRVTLLGLLLILSRKVGVRQVTGFLFLRGLRFGK